VATTIVGITEYFFVHEDIESFFVGGRSFSALITTMGLGVCALDSNALLGNADLAYKAAFFDAAAIPCGLSLSLILNGIFLAPHINREQALTLPDVLARRYGPVVETLVSLASVTTYLMLVAGNLVGFAKITSYLWNVSATTSVWIAAGSIWLISMSGGLFSAASTSVVQGAFCWGGIIITLAYIVFQQYQSASPPSIGFPGEYWRKHRRPSLIVVFKATSHSFSGYIYPDTFGNPICDMYKGVPCNTDPRKCCYNENLWCPNGGPDCDRYDRGAYPWGDKAVHVDQMLNPDTLAPFPNAIVWNWATIFVLGFGCLGALDFQSRCLAGKKSDDGSCDASLRCQVINFTIFHPRSFPNSTVSTASSPGMARMSCVFAACLVLVIGVPFSYMGAVSRYVSLNSFALTRFDIV
jgi:Sodium:solute symporter family